MLQALTEGKVSGGSRCRPLLPTLPLPPAAPDAAAAPRASPPLVRLAHPTQQPQLAHPPPRPTPHHQIYVEIERARLTRQLARMREEEGAVQEAAEILQEVAVVSCVAGWRPDGLQGGGMQAAAARTSERRSERGGGAAAARGLTAAPHACLPACLPEQETFGAMAKTEKIAYILEQVIQG